MDRLKRCFIWSRFALYSPHAKICHVSFLPLTTQSTDIYPEWLVAALTHVDKTVAKEVQDALYALQAYAELGLEIESGANVEDAKCEETRELSKLALEAQVAGNLAGFRNPRSYFEVRTMHEAAGFLKKDERGDWKCTRADTLYSSIDCPAEHYKLPLDKYNKKCASQGLPCPDGYDCYCQPCLKAHEVEVFECDHDNTFVHDADRHSGCDKMSLCGSTQQTKEIQFRIRDNMKREGAIVEVKVHMGGTTQDVPVVQVEEFYYKFLWSHPEVGVGILEVAIDGEQISQSPLRVEVDERDCDIDFAGYNMQPAGNGACVCSDNTIDMGGKCVSATIIAVVFSLVFLVAAFIAGYFYLRYKNHKNDQVWMVGVEELHFDDPVEVIGQGSFGVVLLAEYRGTKVAIKRAIKTGGKRGSTAGRSRGGSKGGSKGGSNKFTRSTTKKRDGEHGGSKGGSSMDHDERSHDSCEETDPHGDPERAENPGTTSYKGSIASGSKSCSVDWMADDLRGGHNKWDWLTPWKKRDDYQSRFRDTVLGENSSDTRRRSLGAMICPWFNAQARQEEEFMSEMRVLSRLRHPCITTVMGAVVSHTHDPMLVMVRLNELLVDPFSHSRLKVDAF